MSRRWLPILVAIDAFLVAAVLVTVMLVVHPAAPVSQAPPGTGTPTTTSSPSATPAPGLPRFQLPSGNIACDMAADKVTCTIASAAFQPPAGADCEGGTVGHTVVLDAHGVTVPCVKGGPPGIAATDVPTLNYGGTSTVGPYTCTSATNGVTCVNTTGQGFRLARAAFTPLP